MLALLLLACGGEPRASSSTTTSGVLAIVEVTSTNPQPAALAAHSLWNGRYECAQGITGLALTLDLEAGGRATAVFEFGPVPENPAIPSGRYLMAGTFFQSAEGTQLTLVPDRWIAQPPGYLMVGLEARIDAPARAMSGRVEHPTCTVLSLIRVQ